MVLIKYVADYDAYYDMMETRRKRTQLRQTAV